MNIQEFVTETLTQVLQGIKAAKDAATETGGDIAPIPRGVDDSRSDTSNRRIQNVDFDIAVTVIESSDTKGGISVMGIGVKGGLAESTSTVSRIKFTVPIVF